MAFTESNVEDGLTVVLGAAGSNGEAVNLYKGGELKDTVAEFADATIGTANDYDKANASSGGVIKNVVVDAGGEANLFDAGIANDVTVQSGGKLSMISNSVASGIDIGAGSTLAAMDPANTNVQISTVNVTGANATVQVKGGVTIDSVSLTGSTFAKVEIWENSTLTNFSVTAGGYIATGTGKKGAFLIVTGANAVADGGLINSYGSASVYDGATIKNTIVRDGGVLTMSYRKLTDGNTAGTAENIDVQNGGQFWVGTLGSTATNITFKSGSFIGGFGMGDNGTTFSDSKVVGFDGVERALANWDGNDYTVVNGLRLIMHSATNDGSGTYDLDLSKVILGVGGGIQKNANDNQFSSSDTVAVRVIDPETGAVIDAGIADGVATNWVINAGQTYDGTKGDGIIMYEGGAFRLVDVASDAFTNGRYVFNDGTVQEFSCIDGVATNMIVDRNKSSMGVNVGTGTIVNMTISGVMLTGGETGGKIQGLTIMGDAGIDFTNLSVGGMINIESSLEYSLGTFTAAKDLVFNMRIDKGGVLTEDAMYITEIDELTAYSLAITVNATQADGEYLLSGSTSGYSVTVYDAAAVGTAVGTLTKGSILTYSGKTYELVDDGTSTKLVVGTEVTGVVTLYKGGELKNTVSEFADATLGSSSDYDAANASSGGVIKNVVVDAGGTVRLQEQGTGENLTLQNGGTLYQGSDSVASGVDIKAGSTLGAMDAANVNVKINDVTISGTNAAAQVKGGVVMDGVVLSGMEFAKVEIWDNSTITNFTVDAGGYIATGTGKKGAYLVVTGAGAVADGGVITNYGSASVYNGAIIKNATVENGGVLTMSYRKLTDGNSAGAAENIAVKAGGQFWVGTLDSTATYVTFSAGSFIGGFGMGSNGTTFNNSKVIGFDGVERELANWDGGDYTVVNGLRLIMHSATNDGSGTYDLDLSSVILGVGGGIQKDAANNVFSYEDTVEGLRVIDPEDSSKVLDSSIAGGKATNWVVNADQRYVVDGGWGAKGSADGLIVYEGGELDTIFVGRPGPISATAGTVITNGRYVFNDGTVQSFSCGNGAATNMIVENGRFVLNGYAGEYNAAKFGSGCVVNNTTMIGGMYVQGNMSYSDKLTTSQNTAIQTYSYAEITSGVNMDEAAESIYRNFGVKDGVASGFIIENGGLLALMPELASADSSLPTLTAGKGKNIVVRGKLPAGLNKGNNAREDGRSYLSIGEGTSADNVIVDADGILVAKAAAFNLTNVTIGATGCFEVLLSNTNNLDFTFTANGHKMVWNSTDSVLTGRVFGSVPAEGLVRTVTLADDLKIKEFKDTIILANGFTFRDGAIYNGILVDNCVFTVYDDRVINGLTIQGKDAFVQITTGTTTDVKLNAGKYETAGNNHIVGITVDGTDYHQAVGVTGDNNKETGFYSTQLVAYAADVVVKDLNLINYGSAFFYNGATLEGVTIADGGVLYLTNWNKDTNTVANVVGDIKVQSGGVLWLGSTNNVISGKIQTYGGSTVTGIASGTVINDIVLRGANINIVEGVTINKALQGGNQSVDGGTVNEWTNNFGVFTMNSGVISSYIHNNDANVDVKAIVSGGKIENFDLTKNAANNEIVGGEITEMKLGGGNFTMTGGTVQNLTANLTVAATSYIYGGTLNGATLSGAVTLQDTDIVWGEPTIWGTGTVSNVTINTGATLRILSAQSKVSNITLDGGNFYNYGAKQDGLVIDTVTINSGEFCVQNSAKNVTLNGGKLNLVGASLTDVTLNGGIMIAWAGEGYVSSLTNVTFNGLVDTSSATDRINWTNVTISSGISDYTHFTNAVINGIKAHSNVDFGAKSVVSGVLLDNGAVAIGYGAETAITDFTLTGEGTWAQFSNGSVDGLKILDYTKFEAFGGKFSNVMVDAAGVETEFGVTGVGAQLVLYGDGAATATNVTLQNGGSAHVYGNAVIQDVVAKDGGVLYMTDWDKAAGGTGTADGVTIEATGGFVYNLNAGKVTNLTIHNGAKLDVTAAFNSQITGKAVMGESEYTMDLIGETKSFVVTEGVKFLGNWTTGIAGTVNIANLTLVQGGSMVGWNLGASTVNGSMVFADGTVKSLVMGATNEFGGKHAENIYFFNGSAVLGSGSVAVNGEGVVTVTYNTAKGLTFDNSLFVMGGMTQVTDLVFKNHACFQGYSNGNMVGVNEDEAADSIYRNFSMANGVADGLILENGGFLQLFAQGANWEGNTPSPAGSAKNMIVRGVRTAAGGNYNAAMMNTYGGGSYLQVASGCTAENILVGSGAFIHATNGFGELKDITFEDGAGLKLFNVTSGSKMNATNKVGDTDIVTTIADGVVTNLYLNNALSTVTTGGALTYNNVTVKAGSLTTGKVTDFTGDLYVGSGATVNMGESNVTSNVNFNSINVDGGSLTTFDLISSTIAGGVTFQNGAKGTITGGNLGDGTKFTVTGEGTLVSFNWFSTSNNPFTIADGAQVNTSNASITSAEISGGAGLYLGSDSNAGSVTVGEGWLQIDNTRMSGNVVVSADSTADSYAQVIGATSGSMTLSGAGAIYVGNGKWGAGAANGGVIVNTGKKDVGNVCLRSGSVAGLNVNGGTLWYNGSYRIDDPDSMTKAMEITGAVKFANTTLVSGNLTQTNEATMDLTKADSLFVGNYTDANISINASGIGDVVFGGNVKIADGKTITVDAISTYDFTGMKDFNVYGLDYSKVVCENISISTINVTNEGHFYLGNKDTLNWTDGITINVDGKMTALIKEANKNVITTIDAERTFTVQLHVDENGDTYLTSYRTSSDDKVASTWPVSWTDAPTVVIPVTAQNVTDNAKDGFLYIQEVGPSSQTRFTYKDPATGGNMNLAKIDAACNGLTVVMGQSAPSQWGGRAATWAEVSGVQNLVLLGGGAQSDAVISSRSNIYVYGEDTTTKAIFGGGMNGFTTNATRINIAAGTHRAVFGGGYGGNITTDTDLVIDGGKFTGIISGGGVCSVGNNVNLTINNMTGTANIYGGVSCGWTGALVGTTVVNASGSVGGSVNVNITGGEMTGLIVGGGRASGEGIVNTVTGDVNVAITGATQTNNVKFLGDYNSAWVVGGGQAVNNGSMVVEGNVNVTIGAGSTVGYVVGGAQATVATSSAQVKGNASIVLSGCSVTGNVFGGGYSDIKAESVVAGNVSITVDASVATAIQGNIYAGGRGSAASVAGNALVSFTGNADNLSFTGKVVGDGNKLAVTGTSTIAFADYAGEFSATIENFDIMSFSGNTVMSIVNNVMVDSVSCNFAGRTDTSVAFVNGDMLDTDKFTLSGIDGLTADQMFALASKVNTGDVTDMVFELLDAENSVIGSFKFGEELVIDGVGKYFASLSEDGMLSTSFELEKDVPAVGKLGMLA